MRVICAAALFAVAAIMPALAQTTTGAGAGGINAQGASQRPIDNGPFTPQANGAYQGGGMVLQGAPGAPPPTPQPTPPGQTPANMVPPSAN